jgi:FAD dependent oxidoreductase
MTSAPVRDPESEERARVRPALRLYTRDQDVVTLDRQIPEPQVERSRRPLRLAVIGAGWYGCHLARELTAAGHQVELFEALPDVFQGASGNTQNRLHLGFHYPRSGSTRRESMKSFQQFKAAYPTLSKPMENNIYAVPEQASLMDAESYLQIMTASGLTFEDCDCRALGLPTASAALRVPEEFLCTDEAAAFFRRTLQTQLRVDHRIERVDDTETGVRINGDDFDSVIDCTWGATTGSIGHVWPDLYFEPCITLVYRSQMSSGFALTMVDGPFFSIYPYKEDLHTLTSVTHTPIGQCASYQEATRLIAKQDVSSVHRIRQAMEALAVTHWPEFADRFSYAGVFFSVKTKMRSGSDARVVSVRRVGHRLFVFAGKASMIFPAADEVRRMLCEY